MSTGGFHVTPEAVTFDATSPLALPAATTSAIRRFRCCKFAHSSYHRNSPATQKPSQTRNRFEIDSMRRCPCSLQEPGPDLRPPPIPTRDRGPQHSEAAKPSAASPSVRWLAYSSKTLARGSKATLPRANIYRPARGMGAGGGVPFAIETSAPLPFPRMPRHNCAIKIRACAGEPSALPAWSARGRRSTLRHVLSDKPPVGAQRGIAPAAGLTTNGGGCLSMVATVGPG